MPITIKTRNFSLTDEKQNGTFDRPEGLGWAPGYEGKSRGSGIGTSKKYRENYDKIDWSKDE